jgi:hypothetical protein
MAREPSDTPRCSSKRVEVRMGPVLARLTEYEICFSYAMPQNI